MKKTDVKPDMLVTCKEPVEAYYSGYPKGHPHCFFEPGDIGIVACVDVPYVVGRDGTFFVCIDFFKPGIINNPHHWQENGESPWRAGIDYGNLHRLTTKELEEHPYYSLLIKVCEPHAENKALIEETFPYQFADIKVPKESPSQVVIRLLHPLSLWQIYWIGMQKGEGRIGPWYALENEMPC